MKGERLPDWWVLGDLKGLRSSFRNGRGLRVRREWVLACGI